MRSRWMGPPKDGAISCRRSGPRRSPETLANQSLAASSFVPEAVNRGTVEFVGAGAAGERHVGARQAADFAHGVRSLHAKFVHGFDRQKGVQAAEGAHCGKHAAGGLGGQSAGGHAGIGAGAVHGEVVGVGPLPVGGELAGFARGWRG